MTIISEIPRPLFSLKSLQKCGDFFIDFFQKKYKKLLTIPLISGIIKTRKAKKGIPQRDKVKGYDDND